MNDAVEDAVLTSNRISVSTFDQIPSFQDIWEAKEKPKVTVIWPITFMLFLGLALILLLDEDRMKSIMKTYPL